MHRHHVACCCPFPGVVPLIVTCAAAHPNPPQQHVLQTLSLQHPTGTASQTGSASFLLCHPLLHCSTRLMFHCSKECAGDLNTIHGNRGVLCHIFLYFMMKCVCVNITANVSELSRNPAVRLQLQVIKIQL